MQNLSNIIGSIDIEEVVEFLQQLVQSNSVNPPGGELQVAQAVARKLASYGISNQVDTFAEGRANVTGIIRGTGKKGALLFNGHLDTVPPGENPWEYDPFSGTVIDGRMYGRGTVDMKSGLAALVMAACLLKKSGIKLQGDLIVAGTAGEESDSIGAKLLVESGLLQNLQAMVIAEPSSLKLFTAHKGCLWLEITTFGQTAHGAMPEQGANAIRHMNRFLHELEQFDFTCSPHFLLGNPTINVGTISGGIKTNVVPDKCTATIDIRTVPGMDHSRILAQIKDILDRLDSFPGFQTEIKVINERVPVETDAKEAIIKAAGTVKKFLGHTDLKLYGVNYYTDASIFVPATGVPALIMGPGDEKLAHQPNESVDIHEVMEAIKFYIVLAARMLGVED
ncbi:M20 family metallopeptidase [Zhaonella formicivorans]|uniref:M20 family metallopeptidase n=1 Tax=Zhaonella formicivorans TaxID=2528593 RepID=UPI001D10CF73|nr:M20 family metallopeptidase [Zhaonella formicivorans]